VQFGKKYITKIFWFYVVMLNNCMNNHKDLRDDALAADWLRDNGISVAMFGAADTKLLQAQQYAHILLTQTPHLLTTEQIGTLNAFSKRMEIKRTRTTLNPKNAYSVLNIATKVNRQLFKLNKHITTTK
jgi:hypothetical protein